MHSDAVTTRSDPSPSPSPHEAEVALAVQLERAKSDIELVSYAISHDLQAPLRAILASCEALEAHAIASHDKEAQDKTRKIIDDTTHLKTLLQGLLDYLRLETFGPSHALLDCNELITVALSILEEKILLTGAKITYDDLPHVYGHRGRLTRLFVNLLDNALKFHSAAPLIHITAVRTGTVAEFCVEDKGIGIDEEYHAIIFELFQRLHTAEAYTGNGIGLALNRKIVESHGGKLWVESTVGEGSRFRFTLPVIKINS